MYSLKNTGMEYLVVKWFWSLVILLVAVKSQAASLPDTIDKVRGSIVSVGLLRPQKNVNFRAQGPAHEYRGTGFVVGNGSYIVTNHHVVPDNLGSEVNAVLAVFSGRGSRVKGYPAQVVRSDKEHDLAVLKIKQSLPALSLAPQRNMREGEEVAFTGFPIGMVLGMYPVTHRAIVSAVTPIVIPAASARQLTAAQIQRMKTPFNIYQLDAVAYPGNSGSPVYDPLTGEVLGVINSVFVKGTKEAALTNPSGIAYAIPSRYVAELLPRE